eukprot:CAMPEP_0176362508 /NCGR_PEP_ID=MMETSP0126-20121128/18478_1 /TAXON_ID=141414 ORGANISM="Strombidinopsis acuminatum, Strain SPMC142" /NCGR_SAMPLE_ID=MMETSP0126 /ASSEMBLY_ACC=CAM_ASM_000229 /LENGTH=67 /DNA_ID=CAMNT_0017718455 /DNA_START=864 /DNA_END=1068 /DNA_ORIENTATION=+
MVKKVFAEMRKSGEEVEFEEEDSDPDKKEFAIEQRRAQTEKMMFFVLLVVGIFYLFVDLELYDIYGA